MMDKMFYHIYNPKYRRITVNAQGVIWLQECDAVSL